jgi:hypothetical protein
MIVPVASPLRLRRLDILEVQGAPVVLRTRQLGDIHIPAGTAVHAWSLPGLLDAPARARIADWIQAARRGSADALGALEATLLASHAQIREDLAVRPDARGAARLRTLLAIFDV